MASPPVFDVERLLAPIPGDNPAGSAPPFDLVRQLDDARKEGDPFGPPRKMDWPGIVQLATDALQTTSKDILVAARLLEASTQVKGFAGLRDSLALMNRLFADCWDRIRPIPEEGEGFDVRGGPLLWLNDAARGAKFPSTIMSVPLIDVRGENFNHLDWRGGRRAEFEAALPGAKEEAVRNLNDDLAAARAELGKLSKTVDERMPELGINLLSGTGTIGTAMADVAETVADLMRIRGFDEPAAVDGGTDGQPDAGSPAGAGSAASRSLGSTRADLYRQLDSIADALQKLEPHSPIPLLIKRAVKLGALPFPQLMRAMIQDSGALDSLDRLLGIEQPAPQ
ncbi:MAG TPA: type VI secretion system ImpA family N-terminal domain-containing protein [Gemmataceae bacterium]|nr:type VI secretion system ImpA family N-terminal domain-containing protein [Gemmataceae bacterium]